MLQLGAALDAQVAAVTPGDGSSYEEAKARACFFFSSSYLGRPSPVEKVLTVLGGDSRTVVPHTYEKMAGIFRQLHLDVGRGKANGVVHQVRDYMLNGRAVGVDDSEL